MNSEAKEEFILQINKYKKNGYYVELGGEHYKNNNHTYKLEQEYDWNGVSIEIVEDLQKLYVQNRKNECILHNALTFDYLSYFKANKYPLQIDSLSVNIDPGYNDNTGRMLGNPAQSLLGLIALPLNKYRFTVIMFEHDSMQHYKNNSIKDAQREILDALGYSLVVSSRSEDWWVDPSIIKYSEYKNFYHYGKDQI